MPVAERVKAYMVFIHLADGEYQHSRRLPDGTWDQNTGDNMRAAAKEVFDAHPDKPEMVAYVVEHGGWHLTYHKNGTVMGTANDQATLPKEAYEIGERLKDAEWEYLPEVWRGR